MTTYHAVNEILLRLMCERIKVECIKMHDGGATTEQINETLAESIIPHYEAWRRDMLERAMTEIEGMTPPAGDLSPPTSLRRN